MKTLKKFETKTIKKADKIKGGDKLKPADMACLGISIEHMATPKMGF